MDKNLKRQDKYPRQTRDEEIYYKVYYYTSAFPIPNWIGAKTFDNLDEAKEYAEYRMREEPRIDKTVVMKLSQITEKSCITDTLKTQDELKHE